MKRHFGLGLGIGLLTSVSLVGQNQTTSTTPPQAPAPAQIEIVHPIEAEFDRANLLFTEKSYPEALKVFSDLLPQLRDSRREEGLFRIAECYRLLGKNPEALGVYSLLTQNSPESLFAPNAWFRQGELLYRTGAWEKAASAFDKASLKADPSVTEVIRFYLALCQARAEKWDSALAPLKEFAAKPGLYCAASAQILAQHFQALSDWKESLTYWKLTLDQSQDKAIAAQASAQGGWVALKTGDTSLAEGLFARTRSLDPTSEWNRLSNTGLAQIYYQAERDAELFDLFNKYRDQFLTSSRAEILLYVARAYYRTHNPIEAVRAFDLFLSQFKDHPAAGLASYERLLAQSQINPDFLNGESASFLANYANSEFAPYVRYLRAMDFSRRHHYAEARPMWQELIKSPPAQVPPDSLWLELVRSLVETKSWAEAAPACTEFIKRFASHPSIQSVRINLAVSYQNLEDRPNALAAWKAVRDNAPANSPELQTATEQIVVLLASAGPSPELTAAARDLLTLVPKSGLRYLAAYTVGADAFSQKSYDAAAPLLQQSLGAESKTWQLPATYRLAWIAYTRKDVEKTARLLADYDKILSTANDPKAPRLPAAFYYWLGTERTDKKSWTEAADYFAQTLAHPEVGELQTPSWWLLGEAQRHLKRWPEAVKSLTTYQSRDPKLATSTVVLLSLAESQTGASLFPDALNTINQVLLQEPEGLRNAQARLLQAEWYLAQKNYAEAAKSYSTLALIYQDNDITPRAMRGAAQMWEKAGDSRQAAEWRQKLERIGSSPKA